jgi:hypothetical protein
VIPRIFFSVDGSPVELADWSMSSTSNLGFDQFRAVAASSRAKRIIGGLDQGSLIEAFTEHGVRIWEGTIAQPPKLGQDGLAHVAAQGHGYRALKSGDRVTPILDNPGAWIPQTLDPVNLPGDAFLNDIVVTNTLSTRSILFSSAGTVGAFECGLAFVARGMNITRLEATLSAVGAAATCWRVFTARLPDVEATRHLEFVTTGGSAFSATGMGSPNPYHRELIGVDFAPSDVVILQVYDEDGTLGSASYTITNPRVWGDYDDDAIFTDQAAKIVARQLGWDPDGVTGKGQAPLTSSDWVGDGASYLSYIAGLEDYCWGVWDDRGHGPLLTYGPYGRTTWEVSGATGASWELDPLERIRRVTIQQLNVDKSLTEISLEAPQTAGVPDDVASEVKGSLNDDQSGTTLAALTAWRTMQRMIRPRYRGQVFAVNAYEQGSGRNAVYEVRAGDLIKITDFSLDGSITLRVHDVEYTPRGVSIGIEATALGLGGAIRGSAAGSRGASLNFTTVSGGAAVYIPPGSSAGGGGGGSSTDVIPGPIKPPKGFGLG